MQSDFFEGHDREKGPPTPRESEPLKLPISTQLYIGLSGIGAELVRAFADPADLSSLRIRTAVLLVNFVFGVVFMTIGGMPVFALPGTFNPAVLAIAILIALVKLRMECFLSLRGLYAAGKQALRKQGLRIPFGSDDVTWYFALFVKISADICLALIVGHLFAQVCFRQEIETSLAKVVAPQNAVLTGTYRAKMQEMLAAAERAKQRDVAEAEKLKGERDALRRQQVAETRRAALPSRGRQSETAAAGRQITNSTLSAFEAKTAAAETQASASSKAYEDLLKNSGPRLRALMDNDPAYVPPPNGLLARLSALRAIGSQDDRVFWGEIAIEAFGVFCEMFLLVLSIARCPSHLSENLYYDYYKRSNFRAVRLAGELKTIKSPPLAREEPVDPPPPSSGAASAQAQSDTPPGPPPKRGRGRPPKATVNGHTNVITNQAKGRNGQ
jgi:hypothetical protein